MAYSVVGFGRGREYLLTLLDKERELVSEWKRIQIMVCKYLYLHIVPYCHKLLIWILNHRHSMKERERGR